MVDEILGPCFLSSFNSYTAIARDTTLVPLCFSDGAKDIKSSHFIASRITKTEGEWEKEDKAATIYKKERTTNNARGTV